MLATLTTFIMTLETVSIDKRSLYGAILNSSYAFSGIFIILLYKFLNNWRITFAILAFMNLIMLIFFYFNALESPRFYLLKRNLKDLFTVFLKIAKINNKEENFIEFINSPENVQYKFLKPLNLKNKDFFDEDFKNKEKDSAYIPLQDNYDEAKENKDDAITVINDVDVIENLNEDGEKGIRENSYFDLLKYPKIRNKFLIVCYLWFSTSAVFHLISLNIKNLPGDLYTNGLLIYGFEIFSYIFSAFVTETFLGRKYSIILFNSIASVGYLTIFIFHLKDFGMTIVSILSRICVGTVFNILYTYSIEIYPTSLRAKGFGLNSVCARIGGIFMPILYEYLTDKIWILFFCLNMVGVVLVNFLPETLGVSLKNELDDEDKTI